MSQKGKNHHLELRRDKWYFVAMHNGKRIKKALSASVVEARSMRDKHLKEILLLGETSLNVNSKNSSMSKDILFGEVAVEWALRAQEKVRKSVWKDYRRSMNNFILPYFGNLNIKQITFRDIEKFMEIQSSSPKRVKNILIPIRSLMKYAMREQYIEKNPMDLVEVPKGIKTDIHPLSMDEVQRFLSVVDIHYKNFFIVAFFTGMRFGEMSALKWRNIDFQRNIIHVKETRVDGEETTPKTAGSIRELNMLPPVFNALNDQHKSTGTKSDYVFLNKHDKPVQPGTTNSRFWKNGLREAGLQNRSLYQTRHTFATLMLDAGELPGWVQRMMGHTSLKMILEHYYKYTKNYQRDDGKAFMDNVYKSSFLS